MLTSSEQQWLDLAAALAVSVEKETGVPAEASLSQAILETGWGQHIPPLSNNFHGIKAVSGQPYVTTETNEFVNGKEVRIPQNFAVYSTPRDSFSAYAKLISEGQVYRNVWGLYQQNRDVDLLLAGLAGIYSTSPDYYLEVAKLMRGDRVVAALEKARSSTS